MKQGHAKRIVVTGGAGFLGSHLCESLLRQGHDVLCVDNFHTGSERNVAHLMPHPGFSLLRHDVVDPLYVDADEIYHLACPASPLHYQHDPLHTTRTCVQGTLNMLGLARRTGAALLQASTSEVYGDPQVHPQREDYYGQVNPTGPRACYAEGKRCAETLCMDYRRHHGVRVRIARIFNTYGPRMDAGDGRVVSNFIVQALSGVPLTIHGDGRQTRSFCYVADLIDGFDRLMRAPAGFCGPVNLGNPAECTMLELAGAVIALCGSRSPLRYLPGAEEDPRRRRPDISLARTQLSWTPLTTLDQGLRNTIAYYAQTQAAGRLLAEPG
jgi:UDP-glucuronate decarboxylase